MLCAALLCPFALQRVMTFADKEREHLKRITREKKQACSSAYMIRVIHNSLAKLLQLAATDAHRAYAEPLEGHGAVICSIDRFEPTSLLPCHFFLITIRVRH